MASSPRAHLPQSIMGRYGAVALSARRTARQRERPGAGTGDAAPRAFPERALLRHLLEQCQHAQAVGIRDRVVGFFLPVVVRAVLAPGRRAAPPPGAPPPEPSDRHPLSSARRRGASRGTHSPRSLAHCLPVNAIRDVVDADERRRVGRASGGILVPGAECFPVSPKARSPCPQRHAGGGASFAGGVRWGSNTQRSGALGRTTSSARRRGAPPK